MPPRKQLGKKELNKDDPLYKEKRNKNNDAVKKSRLKTKTKSGRSESTRLNSSHITISYAVFCLKK